MSIEMFRVRTSTEAAEAVDQNITQTLSSLLGKFLCTDMTLVSCWVHIKLVNVTAPLLLLLLVKLETYSVADAKSLSSIPIWDLVKKTLYHLVSSWQNNFQSR